MTLTLTIIEQPRGAVQSQAGHVVRRGGTIVGRSTACDWILADPKRSLSRRHCLIERRPEGFCLLDLSANGVFVNDAAQPLGPEGVHRLADGDELRLGEYRLAVRCVTALLPGP
ncbi:MAG: type VI secretion system-associated FHA domain protein, partial [Candidatus Competibacterales bacterium]